MKTNAQTAKQIFFIIAFALTLTLSVSAQTVTVLYDFTPGSDVSTQSLVLSSNQLYGSTYTDGEGTFGGTVFRINDDGSDFQTLYSFSGPNEGPMPNAGLVFSGATLYGTTILGGIANMGSVFKINNDGSGFTNLYSFIGPDGDQPHASLILSGNVLYGDTAGGGSGGFGTVFKINIDGSGFSTLYNFSGPDGGGPFSGLTLVGNTLYGTTPWGGSANNGTIFEIAADGNGFTNLYNFTATIGSNPGTNTDGSFPLSNLIWSGNTLYGTTVTGGDFGYGTVFKINNDGSGFSTLHSFSSLDGAYPYGGLILSGNVLYGDTLDGGNSNSGTIFEINVDGSGFTSLYSFMPTSDDYPGTNTSGAFPSASLLLSDGILYGTTTRGGSLGGGTIFALGLTPTGTPTVTTGTANSITANSATLNGSVNPNGLATTAYFQWGTSTAYGNTVPNPAQSCGTGDNSIGVSVRNLTGLNPNSIYHFRLVASSSGGTTYGGDQTFMTGKTSPTISSVSPSPLQAPTQGGQLLTGTFVIRGQNFQGGFVTTDGPLLLTGSAQVSPDGTSIQQNYQIGCCAPYQGEIFHLIVNTSSGTATVQDSVTLSSQTPSSVNGKILSSSGQAIIGASIQIGSASTTSGSDGSYLFTELSSETYPVTVSAANYTTLSSTLTVLQSSQKSQSFTLTPASGVPTVTSITTPYSANGETLYFLDGVTFPVTFTATVNWGNHSAGTIQFMTPNNGIYQVNANGGNIASQPIDVGSAFGAGGQLQVQAISRDGTSSIATVAPFVVMSALPLQNLSTFSVVNEGSSFEYQPQTVSPVQFLSDSLLGDDGVEIDQSIPLFGGNDIDLGFSPTLNATITGNHLDLLQVEISNANSDDDNDNNDNGDNDNDPSMDMAGLQFGMGNPQIDVFGNYDATLQQWQWGGSLGVDGNVGVSATTYLPVPIPVPVFASVDFNLPFDATLTLSNLDPVIWNGTMALDPTVTGTLGAGVDGLIAITGWLQGQVPLTFQYPATPHLVSYQIQLSGGVTAYALLWSYSDQLFAWDWPENSSPSDLSTPLVFFKHPNLPRPYPRSYLNQPSYAAFNGSPGTGFSSAIRPAGMQNGNSNPLLYPLQTDVFPFSESSISANGTNCYAVWLYDDPNRTMNNQTILVFSKFNGTCWSTNIPVADDGTADFHPQLRTFADGSAVAAWENEGAVIPTNANFTAMVTNLQIAAAFYDPAARAWQPMQQLTTNNFLDRSPLIDGPCESNLMLVWVENTNNDLEGSSNNVNQLWFSTYNGSMWSAPQTFASVPYPLLKYDMTYDGTNAYVVMSLDADNMLTNVDAHQLFEVAYQSGTWGDLQDLTSNQVPNDDPQMALDPYGNVVLTWLESNTVSSVVNFNFANQDTVGTNQYSSNLGDFKLANSSDGRLGIVWAAPSPQFPSDLWVMFYDPNFEVWGSPHQLTDDPETEMGTAATFYSANQLIAIYDRADVAIGDTNQIINYGTTITNADLYVLQYQLTNNLIIITNSLTSSPANPTPGDTVTLSVTSENLGDSAVSNVMVAFYQGNPADDAPEIGETNIANLMPPGASNVVSISWTVLDTTNSVPVYAVIDPDQQYPVSDVQNEEINNLFVEPDLAIQALTWGQIATNLLSITATVINQGTIASQPATVGFLLGSLTGTNLFSTNIVSLEPGQSVDVNFIWSVPSLGSGLNLFAVVNTGTNVDFNPQNNALEMMIQPNITQVKVQFGPITVLPNGLVQVSATGLAGQTYLIESSTNSTNWSALTEVTLTNGVGQFVDTSTNDLYQAVALSQAEAQLEAPQLLSGAAQISVTGLAGQTYVLESSTDLVNWTPIYTNSGSFMFADSNAPNYQQRFYRAVLP